MSSPSRTALISSYPYTLTYRTRWSDNDMYAHLNNSIYSHLFDSIINTYLITHCGLSPSTSPRIFLAVATTSTFFAPISFPAVLELGLRVEKLGRSSITWEVAVFEEGREEVRCVGRFVHVLVERETGRTVQGGMGEELRNGVERLVVREREGSGAEKEQLVGKKAKL
ncbi:MAG: hypothetical protein Q9184_003285 [Pyrenodesmia sp. 2 TL-2023]